MATTTQARTDGLRQSREAVATRLLKSSAERWYDPEVDIDWESPPAQDKVYHPEELISLYGTPLWESMTPEQRYELGRQEVAWVSTRGVYAEIGLMQTLLRVAARHGPISAHAQYALTEVAEECRHSIMFGRAIQANLRGDAASLPKPPRLLLDIVRILTAIMPMGVATWASTLMVEDLLDRMQRETTRDETVQPMVRMVNRIHILEEARHMTYAREEMVRCIDRTGPASLAFNRFLIALGAWADPRISVHPKVYANVGLDPKEARRQALANPHRHVVIRRHAKRFVDTMEQAGLIKGRISSALWRRSHMWAPAR
jgi:hypothetical protein